MVSIEIFKTPSGIIKSINIVLIIIAVAIFYSEYGGWFQFIGTTTVSALVYIIFLTLTYILGGMQIQKTLYEIFMNSYFTLMFFISAVVAWVHGEEGGITVTTGVFCFFSFLLFAIDVYFSFKNAGVFKSPTSNATNTAPSTIPNPNPPININAAAAFPSSVNPSVQNSEPAVIGYNYQ